MVDWLAGKRVRGTSSERTPLGTVLGGTAVGGWVELGRTTLGAGADQLDVSSLPDKRYYMYLHWVIPDTYVAPRLRLGNGSVDTGSNYATRRNENGGTDVTGTSQDHITITPEGGANPQLIVGYIANRSANEKLTLNHSVHRKTAGAANEPGRGEVVGKWTNTSNPLDVIRMYNGNAGSGDYASGSELVILGWDPDDTHTNNFWEELASVNTTSGDNLSSGTFTAKKYLWVQMYMKYTSTGGTLHETFNNDTGNNYASRDSYDGGTDGTSTSFTHIDWDRGQQDTYWFINQFIINNASNEKLCIGHQIRIDNTHTGAGTAPHRSERVDKWANTSNQITEIDFDNTTAGIDISNGWLKVWGAD